MSHKLTDHFFSPFKHDIINLLSIACSVPIGTVINKRSAKKDQNAFKAQILATAAV